MLWSRYRKIICNYMYPETIQSRATIGVSAKCHSDDVLLADQFWLDFTCLLGSPSYLEDRRSVLSKAMIEIC